MLRELAENLGEVSAVDLATGLASALPKGLYTGRGLERYVDEVLSDPDRTNDFRMLEHELYLVATDLDTTERVILGEGDWAEVPISEAVAASGALPGIYEPVEINGREFIDGGILSTTNVDVAIERGAKFVVVINPLVPYVNDFAKNIPTITGSRARRVSDMGIAAIANQTFRLLSHDRLHRAVEIWEERYPGVDIILIEPELDDELMFGTSILDYSARLQIAKHGFESVTLKLARDYDRYKSIAERHGIEISARRVRHVLDQVEREREKLSAWRRVLELTNTALLRVSARRREEPLADERATTPPTPSTLGRPAADPHPLLQADLAAVDQLDDRPHLRSPLAAQQPRPELLASTAGLVAAASASAPTRNVARIEPRRPRRPRTRATKSLAGRHERPPVEHLDAAASASARASSGSSRRRTSAGRASRAASAASAAS